MADHKNNEGNGISADGKYRGYFCGFCYPTASDGSDADEIAGEEIGTKAEIYTGKELEKHITEKHTKDILSAFFEQFTEDHSGWIGKYNLYTGEKV